MQSELSRIQRRKDMDFEEMNMTEALIEKTEENQTRKILEIIRESKDKEEAVNKVQELLKK